MAATAGVGAMAGSSSAPVDGSLSQLDTQEKTADLSVASTEIDVEFLGTVEDERMVTVTANDVTRDGTFVDGETVAFTVGDQVAAKTTVESGTASAEFDPGTLNIAANQSSEVGLAGATVSEPTTVTVVHEAVDLDDGYNLASVPQSATLSVEHVAAVNAWDAEKGTYDTVTDFTFESARSLHGGIYVVANGDEARLGYTYTDDAPAPGVVEMPTGWNFVGSNFAIDSSKEGDSRSLQTDLPDVDAGTLTVFDVEFDSQLTPSTEIGAYQPYWVYVGSDSGVDRAIVDPPYDRVDRTGVLAGSGSQSALTIENNAPAVAPAGETITIPAAVTNTADTEQTGVDVELVVADQTVATQNVTVASDDSQTVEFVVDASTLGAGPGETVEHTVSTPDDQDTATLELAESTDPIILDSVSSLLDDAGDPLTDDSIIALSAESTATNGDEDGNGDAVSYPDEADIPVVAVDGTVVGVTGPFATTGTNFAEYGNEEYLLNLHDELLGGSGTVLHDEGHGQYYTLADNGGDDFQAFAEYAEENGYTHQATTDLEGELPDADAVVITSPSEAYTDSELDALSDFVDDGGVVFLHDQSDFSDYDETANHNEIADAVNASFRFNDDQVFDETANAGSSFLPETTNANTQAFPELFVDRSGLGQELETSESYEVEVVSVADGDTADVKFQDGTVDTVRILGIDTPETGSTDERLVEYEGIDDGPALKTKADSASAYAKDTLEGETVTLSFDDNEGLRGNFGRLLGVLELSDGTVYNAAVIEDGWARVYDSGLERHDKYLDLEASAREANRGMWNISDPAATPEVGDEPVEQLFFPDPVEVTGSDVPVRSEDGDPLVALDAEAGVAVVGGPLIEEGFESGEGGPGTDEYGAYPFMTNVIDTVGTGTGPVVVDGGHGQFAADFAVSAEDTAYYMRYLEGQSTAEDEFIGLEATTELTSEAGPDLLTDGGEPAARALIISTPTSELTAAERSLIDEYTDAGGAAILVGTAADTDALDNFDPLLSDLGTDVGFTANPVTDETNNLAGDSAVPTTANFDDAFPGLFTPVTDDGSTTEPVTNETIDPLVFDSASTLLNENGEPLTDESVTAVSAKSTAYNTDSDGNGDAVSYPDGTDIPLAAIDGTVVGITAPLVGDGTDFEAYGNDEFLLNLYDDQLGGSGTVLHDEGHGQFYDRSSFATFASTAEANGYTYQATTDIENDLPDADAVVITSPGAFTDSELTALTAFVNDGGVVFLHDQSDYNDFDETANHNEIADALGATFRFNDDQVQDDESNDGVEFVPVTDDFDTEAFPGLFELRNGGA
ncbi:DUF4350 domain-containing protein [Natronoarchaeum sp. GCM10025703]|uniref:DUF4350 domain-containing protein n=1 Tax=unclassified Natronoarchaeum TaxID=2620183 RepID=UPI003622E512